jgi:transcriptional regulator with XRE-family HTH domain
MQSEHTIQRLDTHYNVHLGRTLRRLRQARGWSIDEAANRANLSRNTLSNVERSVVPNPTLSTLFSLMELYEIQTIEGLLGSVPSSILLDEWVAQGRPGLR